MHRRFTRCAALSGAILMGLAGAGCAAPGGGASTPARPGVITHPVFVTLTDPADAPELIRDCDRWIATIPGVVSYACGTPYDSGRQGVDDDYDVGLVIGFDSASDYAAYIDHPQHVRLVEKWRPRLRGMLVRDVLDQTP